VILRIYTIIHTLISLVAIFAGVVVLLGMLAGKPLDGWTKWFLVTTVASTLSSTGHEILDNAALRVFRQWWEPRTLTTVDIPIEFTIKGVFIE
jgi:hypothetical protein